MKKTFIFLALLVAIFSTSMVQAKSFTLINSNFSISGYLEFGGSYNTNSSTPIYDELNSDYSPNYGYASSGASYDSVYADSVLGETEEEFSGAYASASTTLVFRPNFNGQGPTINFTLESTWFGFVDSTLTDTTTSIELLYIYSPINDFSFAYDAWNPDHEYRLFMSAYAMAFCTGDWDVSFGYTDVTFNNVPEPATMLLLGLGLIGVAGLRRKFRIFKFKKLS